MVEQIIPERRGGGGGRERRSEYELCIIKNERIFNLTPPEHFIPSAVLASSMHPLLSTHHTPSPPPPLSVLSSAVVNLLIIFLACFHARAAFLFLSRSFTLLSRSLWNRPVNKLLLRCDFYVSSTEY